MSVGGPALLCIRTPAGRVTFQIRTLTIPVLEWITHLSVSEYITMVFTPADRSDDCILTPLNRSFGNLYYISHSKWRQTLLR